MLRFQNDPQPSKGVQKAPTARNERKTFFFRNMFDPLIHAKSV
jgi:hypothetical protein